MPRKHAVAGRITPLAASLPRPKGGQRSLSNPLHQATWLATLQKLAAANGGLLLSTKYLGCDEKLLWQCAEGHRWQAAPRAILRGRWCAACRQKHAEEHSKGYRITPLAASLPRPHSDHSDKGQRRFAPFTPEQKATWLATLQKLAAANGGLLLSTEYQGYEKKLLWQCANGHRWQATPFAILQGRWCAACHHESQRKGFARIAAIVAEHGGECLSADRYRTVYDRLEWRCAKGHTWEATAADILSGCWCRKCAFDSMRLGLAKVQEIAREHGCECLASEYVNADTTMPWRCAAGHEFKGSISSLYRKKKDWCAACAKQGRWQKRLADMRELAASRGGLCLSDAYEGQHKRLRWQCKMGHSWMATPASVQYGGSWCPECYWLSQCKSDAAAEKYQPDKMHRA
jgi:hypothetical protein